VRYYAESASVAKGDVGSKSDMARLSFGDILQLVERNDYRACKALNQMAYHLGVGIAMLETGLAPDVLLVVGEVTRAWDRIRPVMVEALLRRPFSHTGARIMAIEPDTQPQLRAAVALVLQKHFNLPLIG
jgi:predicted NBD/HSP70 family sugar kinase